DNTSSEGASGSGPRLLDQVRDCLRLKHYSPRTETAYLQWVKRFIIFPNKPHPLEMGKHEVEAFLTSLAVDRNVSAATQSQALSALLFLYKEVLAQPLPWLDEVTRVSRPPRLPTVLTQAEVQQLIAQVSEPLAGLVI